MSKLINLTSYPVSKVLSGLLEDKTTKQNIVFATDSYSALGNDFLPESCIDQTALLGMDSIELQPRVTKALEQQALRTKVKAEVMTPSWICCKMNNHCDDVWFGRENVFNVLTGKEWVTTTVPVEFDENRTWQQYVDSKRIEITCGEGPYLVSRYDTTTGTEIPFEDRIGFLDRKLRIVNENTSEFDEWYKWTLRAFQASYGYEYQGDNLLIARINLLNTFVDHMRYKWQRDPEDSQLRKIANIICWNIWQMDGLTGMVPYAKQKEQDKQMTFWDIVNPGQQEEATEPVPAKIFDWRSNESVTYNSIKESM